MSHDEPFLNEVEPGEDPEYPGLGRRAKVGEVIHRADWPKVPPTYADGTPIQLYDRVRVPSHDNDEHVVTKLTIRCWGRPGRYQQWIGDEYSGKFKGKTRWWDHPEEQVWVEVDALNIVLRADQVERVLTDVVV